MLQPSVLLLRRRFRLAALRLGYCRHSAFVVGIGMSGTSKNPYVDVPYDYHVLNMRKVVESVHQAYIIPRQFGVDYRLIPRKRAGRQEVAAEAAMQVSRPKK